MVLAVNAAADGLIADIGVDLIGKINRTRTLREAYDLTSRRKDIDAIREEVDFDVLKEFAAVGTSTLDKLMTETEKEMQAVQDAAIEKDLQKLDSLTHHLRSSWEVLRADQPLRELYGLLHGDTLPDGEALSRAVTAVLEKGAEIIRLAEKERRKYEDG